MKSFVIALKDLKQSFRSAFALMFMFVIPLLVTGMFYLMFGKESSQPDAALPLAAVRLIVVNLDEGDSQLAYGLAQTVIPGMSSSQAATLGELVLAALQSPELSEQLQVEQMASESDALAKIEQQAADVVLVIPASFSRNYASGDSVAEITAYYGSDAPASAIIVNTIMGHLLGNIAGMRIAMSIIPQSELASNSAAPGEVAQQYMQSMAQITAPASLLELRVPDGLKETAEQGSPLTTVVGPIMGGMMIFFAFYTGASTAQTILKESEQGTLARLFTTATEPSTILNGKLISVGLTVLVQVVLLLIAARLIFRIDWGTLPAVAMAAVGIIACASSFGVFLSSLVKTTRQGGAVFGGLLTVTGMLGMLPIFTSSSGSAGALETVSLLMPQGWAVRSLLMSMRGAELSQMVVNLLVLLVISVFFMAAGVWKFQRRFAS